MKPFSLQDPGTFAIGCNYWASHAGTNMWTDWQPAIVREDLRRLADLGIQCMRVFPLWSDFQPIQILRSGQGSARDIRFTDDSPLPHTDAGQAGLSQVMLDRFAEFCELNEKAGIHLIVGLLTGWMSGRLYIPPAFNGRNVLTDPFCLQWEVRFVREFIRALKNQQAIYAWDLGNECNVMGEVKTSAEAFAWSAQIANTIRATDPTRPVVSGMHSLGIQAPETWLIQDQGETTDILTTHPYPYWVRWCRSDPINTNRILLHATSETRLYGDIAGKTSIVEEIGTMGPMISDEQVAADFTRTNLFSLWAHDCRSYIWWCASDQTALAHPPYDWTAVERELGLLRNDGTPKPAALEMAAFRKWLDKLPFEALPPRLTDAVCVLTRNQDQWAAAFSTFVLAKQAGLDITFQYVDQPLRDSPCYLLPSLTSPEAIPGRVWSQLLAKAREGATLYLSLDDAILAGFNEFSGLEITTRSMPAVPRTAILADHKLPITSGDHLRIHNLSAQVLAAEADGNPVFALHRYGKGCIFTLTFPLEVQVTSTPGAFHLPASPAWHKIYSAVASALKPAKGFRMAHPMLGATEHPLSKTERVIVIINYSPETALTDFKLEKGWKMGSSHQGALPTGNRVELAAHQSLVFTIVKGK